MNLVPHMLNLIFILFIDHCLVISLYLVFHNLLIESKLLIWLTKLANSLCCWLIASTWFCRPFCCWIKVLTWPWIPLKSVDAIAGPLVAVAFVPNDRWNNTDNKLVWIMEEHDYYTTDYFIPGTVLVLRAVTTHDKSASSLWRFNEVEFIALDKSN